MNGAEGLRQVAHTRLSWRGEVLRQFGLRGALSYWCFSKWSAPMPGGRRWPTHFRIRPRELRHSVFGRCRTSDRSVLGQILIAQEYAPAASIEDVRLIVDCGANVGYTSAYFLSRFPGARLVAVEPDDENFTVCKRNLAPYFDRVTLWNAGIWSRSTGLKVCRGQYADGSACATQVRECLPGETADVSGVDIPTLMEREGADSIDLLKVDIEEAEKVLFSEGCHRWLDQCKNIVIELHGEECEQAFWKGLAGYQCEVSRRGELTLCRNIRSASAGAFSTSRDRAGAALGTQ